MSGSAHVTLDVPEDSRDYLRRTFEGARHDLLADLAEHGTELRDPERSRREVEVYGRLLAALDGEPLPVDDDVTRLLGELAASHDEANEYVRVTFEHEALYGLLAQVDAARGGSDGPEATPEGGATLTLTAHEAGEVRWALIQQAAGSCEAAVELLRSWLAEPAPDSQLLVKDAVPYLLEGAVLAQVVDREFEEAAS